MSDNSAKKALNAHSVSGVFVFFLIGMFAVLAATLTPVSFRAYRSVSQASAKNSEGQIALSYLLGKVHSAEAVGLQTVDGTDVLCLGETIDGESYETRIYYADGALREYFCPRENPFDRELGAVIADLASLSIQEADARTLLIEAVQPDGKRQSLHISLVAGEVGP